tara:strand:- start:140 stop:2602 length:2463 start_codon:yes stop_codon:yes gene_type:complete
MMTNLKRTWNDNPFDQWTEEELLSMEGQGICYGKGGGGSPPPPAPAPSVQTNVNQSEFPTELKPFIEDIFGKAQGIQRQREREGFQGFQGPLQAEFDPSQTRAFEAIENIPGATKPLFDEATSFARQATTAPTDPAEVAAFMNPFLRNVTDIQKREAERVADVQEQRLGAQAAQAGAFGGSRAAILEAERQRNLGQQLDDIEARGLAASFQDAQTRLGQQRAREAAGATQLASLGSAIPAQQLKELGALSGVGAARQTQAQRGIDLARQEFEAEEAFPLRTLQEFSSILRGFPIDPTRTTTSQQFSAAQPLSTQLLGVGTQALGALGQAGIRSAFGQAGGMVKEMPMGYQGGGALSSLLQKTQDLDASPVIQMAKGGDILSFLSPAFGALRAGKKEGLGGLASFLSPAFAASRGQLPAGLQNLLGGGGGGSAPPPPVISKEGLTQEEVDKQIDAALRQRAAQAQQAGAQGTGQGQVGSQVRQSFKGGGGLQQMVNLPTNRVQFGKTAYQDVTTDFDLFLDNISASQAAMAERDRQRNELLRQKQGPLSMGSAIFTEPAGTAGKMYEENERINEQLRKQFIGAAPSALGGEEVSVTEDFEVAVAEAPDSLRPKEDTKDPKTKKGTDDPKTKKTETDLYRSPEEAAYASLMDSDAGQKAAKRYFAGENVTLANISEALKAYKGFKDTEMGQRRKISEAKLKKAASERAARTATLKDAEILARTASLRDEPARVRLKAATEGMKIAQATLDDPILRSQAKSDPAAAAKVAKAEAMAAQFARLVQRYSQESAEAQAIGGLTTPQSILGANPSVQKMVVNAVKGK